MKKPVLIFSAIALALGGTLGGCASVGPVLPQSPAILADQTTLDERGLVAMELAYTAARTSAEAAVDASIVDASTARQIAAIDRAAFAALAKARLAYDLGNATSYTAALDAAGPLVAQLTRLVKGQ
jgi:hypothetical protein